jgi:hypothetical protein
MSLKRPTSIVELPRWQHSQLMAALDARITKRASREGVSFATAAERELAAMAPQPDVAEAAE